MARQTTPDLLGAMMPPDDLSLAAMIGAPGALPIQRDGIQNVPVEWIDDNPFQPRVEYSGIEELAADIASNGLLQVPKGRWSADRRVQLQYGHRRLRAVIHLGWQTMPIEMEMEISDEEMAARAWSENHNRQDFTAIDQARYFRKLVEAGWSQKQIAERLAVSAPTISNTLRLLELPDDLQLKIVEKQLSARQGEALVSLMMLPQAIREAGERGWDDDKRPSSIVRAALDGASSDSIRKRTTDLIRISATAVHDEPWYDIWYDMVLSDDAGAIVSSTCKSCPSTIRRDNGVFCTGPAACLTNKARRFALDDLRAASEEIGLPAAGLLEYYGSYTTMDEYETRATLRRLLDGEGCPHSMLQLRWLPPHRRSSNGRSSYPKFPQAEPVCNHGQNKRCRCLLADQRAKSAHDDSKTTASAQKLILRRAVPILAEAFMQIDEALLRYILAGRLSYQLGPNSTTLAWSRQELAEQMAERLLKEKLYDWDSVNNNKQKISAMFLPAGLRDPFALIAGIDGSDEAAFPKL